MRAMTWPQRITWIVIIAVVLVFITPAAGLLEQARSLR